MKVKRKIDQYPRFSASTIDELHQWLRIHHQDEKGAWVILNKKTSGKACLNYSDLVDELLCFGWIDSVKRSIDQYAYEQFISPRKAKSNWSRVNKEKIEKLLVEQRIYPKGMESVNVAKENGSWNILDEVEALILPNDLKQALSKNPGAGAAYEFLSRTKKRYYLMHLLQAKTETTRINRIKKIIEEITPS